MGWGNQILKSNKSAVATWSCFDSVNSFIKTGCPVFELNQTDITKISLSPFTVAITVTVNLIKESIDSS